MSATTHTIRHERRSTPRSERASQSPALAAAVLQRWPLPALLAWGVAWFVWVLAMRTHTPVLPALVASLVVPALVAWQQKTGVRRLLVLAGFPVSLVATGVSDGALASVGSWIWLVPLAILLLAYPWQTWRDAPFWPTRSDALEGLPAQLDLPVDALILDAGCGAGHGLDALRRQFPLARLEGIEHSGLLARIARWRCASALVRRGDMWGERWNGYDVLYLFQRPETMPRAWAKAQAEMRAGSWLLSLDFEIPGVKPTRVWQANSASRPVHIYRIGG